MSDTFQYRKEIDLQKMVDEQALELQRRVDEATLDKAADTLADFGYVKADGKNRWFELFGTPERAARTMARMCMCAEHCEACPLFDQGLPHCERDVPDIGSIEFWLRGDA